jgi:purine-binding chemotaxis protein CheW
LVVLTFQVGHYWCALPAPQIQEIVAIAATIQVPGQPSMLEGFLNLRGTLLPVVRTAALFNIPFQAGLYAPIVIVRTSHGALGLLVSQVESVLTVDRAELHPLAADHVANEYAGAEFSIEDRKVILVDCARLLLSEERRRLAEMQAIVEQRISALQTVAP